MSEPEPLVYRPHYDDDFQGLPDGEASDEAYQGDLFLPTGAVAVMIAGILLLLLPLRAIVLLVRYTCYDRCFRWSPFVRKEFTLRELNLFRIAVAILTALVFTGTAIGFAGDGPFADAVNSATNVIFDFTRVYLQRMVDIAAALGDLQPESSVVGDFEEEAGTALEALAGYRRDAVGLEDFRQFLMLVTFVLPLVLSLIIVLAAWFHRPGLAGCSLLSLHMLGVLVWTQVALHFVTAKFVDDFCFSTAEDLNSGSFRSTSCPKGPFRDVTALCFEGLNEETATVRSLVPGAALSEVPQSAIDEIDYDELLEWNAQLQVELATVNASAPAAAAAAHARAVAFTDVYYDIYELAGCELSSVVARDTFFIACFGAFDGVLLIVTAGIVTGSGLLAMLTLVLFGAHFFCKGFLVDAIFLSERYEVVEDLSASTPNLVGALPPRPRPAVLVPPPAPVQSPVSPSAGDRELTELTNVFPEPTPEPDPEPSAPPLDNIYPEVQRPIDAEPAVLDRRRLQPRLGGQIGAGHEPATPVESPDDEK